MDFIGCHFLSSIIIFKVQSGAGTSNPCKNEGKKSGGRRGPRLRFACTPILRWVSHEGFMFKQIQCTCKCSSVIKQDFDPLHMLIMFNDACARCRGVSHRRTLHFCLVPLSLSEAGPARFGRQQSTADLYHAMPCHGCAAVDATCGCLWR